MSNIDQSKCFDFIFNPSTLFLKFGTKVILNMSTRKNNFKIIWLIWLSGDVIIKFEKWKNYF